MTSFDFEKYFEYFDRSVLSIYRSNSHVYKVVEDDMGGEIRVTSTWDEKDEEKFPYIELKFGFRKLKDKTNCIELISVLTKYSVGIPFFKYSENILLNYPSAENTEEYTRANLELYRLVIDGMQQDAIVKLSEYLNITLTDKSKRLNSLKELLPYDKIER